MLLSFTARVFFIVKGVRTPPTQTTMHKLLMVANGILTFILFFAGLFFLLEPRHSYLRTRSTNNDKKRATVAGDTTSKIFE